MEEHNFKNTDAQEITEESAGWTASDMTGGQYQDDIHSDSDNAYMDYSEDPEDFFEQDKKQKRSGLIKEIFSWVRIFVIAIVIALLINNFVIINANVPSGSMENTIMTKDRMIGLRTSYWFSSPKRGDIIIFNNPEYTEGQDSEDSKLYVKRVIGQPGEKITIKDAKVYVNDSATPIKEDYLKEAWYVNAGFETNMNFNNGEMTYYVPKKGDTIVVKEGIKYLNGKEVRIKDSYLTDGELKDGNYKLESNCYFVMGDNRNDSSDARYWISTNYVSEDDVLARAVFGYYPWRGFYDRPDYK